MNQTFRKRAEDVKASKSPPVPVEIPFAKTPPDDQIASIDPAPVITNLLPKPEVKPKLDVKRSRQLTALEAARMKGQLKTFQSFAFDFALPDTSGKEYTLKQLKGKVVIVNFWGTWCPACKAEIPHFIDLYRTYHSKGLEVVGLSYERGEAKSKINAYVAKAGIPYPCLVGDSATSRKVPDLRGFPTTLFLDRNGTVRQKLVGFHPKERLESIVLYLLNETDPPEPEAITQQPKVDNSRVERELASFKPFRFQFKLRDARSSRVVSLDSYAGKVLIVGIGGTWCPPCRAEIPHFIKLLEEYKDDGLDIVGIHYERVPARLMQRTISSFVRKNKIPYKCLIGNTRTKSQIPGFRGYPTTLFIDRKGKVRLKVAGLQSHARLEEVVKTLLKEGA